MNTNTINIGIIGKGYVGTSLEIIFSKTPDYYNLYIYDKYYKKVSTHKLEQLVEECDILFVCVPTPMDNNGEQDLGNILDVFNNLYYLKAKQPIVIKSTVLPGTTDALSKMYKDLNISFSPEFLREKHLFTDAIHPSRTVLGTHCEYTEKIFTDIFEKIEFLEAPFFIVKPIEAELVKYAANSFLALKVIYCNEFKEVCDTLNVNYDTFRKLFASDSRIGFSHTEVPGHDGDFGYGGKCLPKDVKALINWANHNNVSIETIKLTDKLNEKFRKNKDWEEIVGATSKNNYKKD